MWLAASQIVRHVSGKVLTFSCSPCGVHFLKRGLALQAWWKDISENPPTATATAVAALRVTQFKRSPGVVGGGLAIRVCEKCYRSARRPAPPIPPPPARAQPSTVGFLSPTPPTPLPRTVPCLQCQHILETLQKRTARAERLLARVHARVRAFSEELATARAASPSSLPQQTALAVGESRNNGSLTVAEFLREVRAGNHWSDEDQVNL